MKNVLFVDDEPRLLEGLQRMLRPQRRQWDMSFAASGEAALKLMGEKPIDVIVTDMRMPEMDGARLLELVRERHPGVVRIVLSGYFEKGAALRAAPLAHRFLAKPCEPEKLREAIEDSCAFSALLPDSAIRRVIGAVGTLPSLPRAATELMVAVQEPDVPLDRIGRIIEHDVGMTAKVLQLVNSAFFGIWNHVSSVQTAAGFLGMDTLRQLVLTVEVFRTFRPAEPVPGFSLETLESHSNLAARIAAKLPAPPDSAAAAIVASMLHDAGKLVLAARMPHEFEAALEASARRNVPLHRVETELTGTSHAEIGAYLLGLWGLPAAIVDAVSRHHHPASRGTTGPGLDLTAITHIADALSWELTDPSASAVPESAGLLDLEYLGALGVRAELPAWREMARQMARGCEA
jgi:HD-like signal output (HDOD) protein/CheY-like chemotaxis protein